MSLEEFAQDFPAILSNISCKLRGRDIALGRCSVQSQAQSRECTCLLLLQVQTIMKRLKFHHTNYGFCKNLTEHMLAGYHNKPFPVCISRPVSVGCIAKGPCPGYVGNTSGATGIILSVACGRPKVWHDGIFLL